MINITNVAQSNLIFFITAGVAILLTLRRKREEGIFPPSVTEKLKGLGILMVVFAHIGLFLVSDRAFLYPLSIVSGVGVDIFLFLSGYGLTVSAMQKPLPILQYYRRRLSKLYAPFWLALAAILAADYAILGKTYPLSEVLHAVVGYFPQADLWHNINSPLWYFSFILFFYLIFPLLFIKKAPWLSASLVALAAFEFIKWDPAWIANVQWLYRLHYLAFPIGMFTAWVLQQKTLTERITSLFASLRMQHKLLYYVLHCALMAVLAGITYYTIFNSGVGGSPEKQQVISLITAGAIILLFTISLTEVRILSLFGAYHYEIYLLHWPIMARYDILYKFLPAWLATVMYLVLLVVLGWIWQNLTEWVLNRFTPRPPRTNL